MIGSASNYRTFDAVGTVGSTFDSTDARIGAAPGRTPVKISMLRDNTGYGFQYHFHGFDIVLIHLLYGTVIL